MDQATVLQVAVWSVLILLFGGAVALLIWGFRGRRIGAGPRCPTCGCSLTGTVSDRCPECGNVFKEGETQAGYRQRRPLAIAFGMLLLVPVVSVMVIGIAVRGMRYSNPLYTQPPTAALYPRAKNSDPFAVVRLALRYRAGLIEAQSLLGFVPQALDEIEVEPETKCRGAWIEFLEMLEAGDELSDDELKRFHAQLVDIVLECRPQVRQSESLFVTVSDHTRLPDLVRMTYVVRDATLRIGEEEWEEGSLLEGGHEHAGGSRRTEMKADRYDVGTIGVAFRGTLVFTQPAFEMPIELKGEVEILPADAPPTVKLVQDAALEAELKKVITAGFVNRAVYDPPMEGSRFLSVSAEADPLINCAFRILIRVDDQEKGAGSVVFKSPLQTRGIAFSVDDVLSQGQVCDLILRSDVELALREPDVFEIWDGELVWTNLRVP